MLELLKRFVKEEDGASMVEYGLLAALVALVAIAALTTIGTRVGGVFESIRDALPGTGS